MIDGGEAELLEGQGALGLEDAEFWGDPFRTRAEVEDPLFEQRADRMILDGPRVVPIEARSTCPVAVLRVAPLPKICALAFDDHAVVAAVDLAGNRVHADLALPPVDNRLPAGPDGDAPSDGPASEAFRIDLREQLSLPWAPADYLVTVILRDEVSPRIRVSLTSAAYEDPEAKRFHEEQRRAAPPAAIWPAPGPSAPIYRAGPSSPPLPEGVGVTLAASRVVPTEAGARALLSGSFRLPIREVDRVERPGGVSRLPAGAELLDGRPTAVVPITLLLTGATSAAPYVWRLAVPSFDAIEESASAALATGYFTVDLAALGPILLTPETFFIHAFSGEVMSREAARMAVTLPERFQA